MTGTEKHCELREVSLGTWYRPYDPPYRHEHRNHSLIAA